MISLQFQDGLDGLNTGRCPVCALLVSRADIVTEIQKQSSFLVGMARCAVPRRRAKRQATAWCPCFGMFPHQTPKHAKAWTPCHSRSLTRLGDSASSGVRPSPGAAISTRQLSSIETEHTWFSNIAAPGTGALRCSTTAKKSVCDTEPAPSKKSTRAQ